MPEIPVSALVCALLFLRPALRTMLGLAPAVPAFEKALLGAAMRRTTGARTTSAPRSTPQAAANRSRILFPTQDSAMLMTLAKADALIRRVPFAKPARPGDKVEIIRLDAAAGGF